MPALSIRHMNYTLARREQAGNMGAVQIEREKSRYWHVEKKARKGWVFVRDLIATKAEAAELWKKHYCHLSARHRLRHVMSY